MDDLLDLNDDSYVHASSHNRSNAVTVEAHSPLDLLSLADDADGSAKEKAFGPADRNILEDDFGDFQDTRTVVSGIQTEANLGLSGQKVHTAGELDKNVLQDLQDQEEFGEFIDSPRLNGDVFQAVDKTDERHWNAPLPAVLLDVLRQTVLFIPQEFLDNLAQLPHAQRQAVLQHRKTSQWLQGVVEGFTIAQRIINGRQRRNLSRSEAEAAQLASVRTAEVSETLLPRLSSLSQGRLKIKGVNTISIEPSLSVKTPCGLCFTDIEQDDHATHYANAKFHKSCKAFLEHHFLT